MIDDDKGNGVAVFDLVIKEQDDPKICKDVLRTYFSSIGKKWVFQLEMGDLTGYRHFQCRISLKKRKRVVTFLNELNEKWGTGWGGLKITSKANKNNFDYCEKEETRLEGPWRWDDEPKYIPRQLQGISLWKWQERVVHLGKQWDTRHVDCIYDPDGNNGKSTLAQYMNVYKLGRLIPFCNDFKDILRMVMDMPKMRCYLIDMPRAINKEKLFQFWAAIEMVKSGYAYDDRYSFKDEVFDCPNIWVFTNSLPDKTLLTNDRWRFWKINDKKDLRRWHEPWENQ